MPAQDSEAFFNKEMTYLVIPIGKINALILRCKNQKHTIGVSQCSRLRQQFIDQLNTLLQQYNLQISANA